MPLYLGMMAMLCERHEDAARHFAEAERMARAMNAQPALARTLAYHARLVNEADPVRAATMRSEAREIAQRCGLQPVLDATETPTHASDALAFIREGDIWTVSFGVERFSLPDRLGLHYLARLTGAPRMEIRATDLVASGAPPVATGADDVLDARAKQEYKRRLAALREELDEAKEEGDADRAIRAEEELDALTHELQAAAGLGGRARKLGSDGERARISVTKAIKGALAAIGERSPTLGAHLTRTVRTGNVCSYAPERTGEQVVPS